MNEQQQHALAIRNTDVQGALRRFGDNEELFISCLVAFLQDQTMSQLNTAIAIQSWDDAFTAAHALKGLAGNMGFIPLMHSTGQLVVLIRSGRKKEIYDSIEQVNSCYRDITDAIRLHFI